MAQWITMRDDFFRKICTSHFIVRVRKGLLRVLLWEGVGNRTELQYIDPHSYGRQRCVFLVLQGCSTGGPGAQFSAGWWLYFLHLITNWSPKLHRGSGGPLLPGVAFPTNSPTHWLPVFIVLSNSSTPTQSPTQSLEWHVWSSSSGNDCHAVQRSLSSGASVYECTMDFLPCPISSAKPAYAISSHKCHWNVSLPSGASPWNGKLGRSKVIIQQQAPIILKSYLANKIKWNFSQAVVV